MTAKKEEQASEPEENTDSTQEEPSAVSEADAEQSDDSAAEEPVAEEAKS